MPQSLACVDLHFIFSTKNRASFLSDAWRRELHAYAATVLQNLGCYPDIINSMPDHVHILAGLGRGNSMSDVVKDVKTATSHWIKARHSQFHDFAWQNGYAVFAVSASNVKEVREYIINQAEHHKARSFQDEYRAFLDRHGVKFDERYVWD